MFNRKQINKSLWGHFTASLIKFLTRLQEISAVRSVACSADSIRSFPQLLSVVRDQPRVVDLGQQASEEDLVNRSSLQEYWASTSHAQPCNYKKWYLLSERLRTSETCLHSLQRRIFHTVFLARALTQTYARQNPSAIINKLWFLQHRKQV